MVLVAVALGACVLYPAAATWWGRQQYRRRWGIVRVVSLEVGAGPYRSGLVAQGREAKAPPVVVVAAWGSFFLGQMVVPGVLLVLMLLAALPIIGAILAEPLSVGLAVVPLALAAASGLALAARLLHLGRALLAREDGCSVLARGTATWSIVHNLVLAAAMGLSVLVDPRELIYVAAPVWLYGALSIGQAVLLRAAARAVDRHAELELAVP